MILMIITMSVVVNIAEIILGISVNMPQTIPQKFPFSKAVTKMCTLIHNDIFNFGTVIMSIRKTNRNIAI